MKKKLNILIFGLLILGSCDVLLAEEEEKIESQKSLDLEVYGQNPGAPVDYCKKLQEIYEKAWYTRAYERVFQGDNKSEYLEKCRKQGSEDRLSNRRVYLHDLSAKIAAEKASIVNLSYTINNIRVQLGKVKADQATGNLTEEEQLALYEQETQLKSEETYALRDIHSRSIAFQKLWQEKDEYILFLKEDRQNLNLHEEERIERSEKERKEIVSLVRGLLHSRNIQ